MSLGFYVARCPFPIEWKFEETNLSCASICHSNNGLRGVVSPCYPFWWKHPKNPFLRHAVKKRMNLSTHFLGVAPPLIIVTSGWLCPNMKRINTGKKESLFNGDANSCCIGLMFRSVNRHSYRFPYFWPCLTCKWQSNLIQCMQRRRWQTNPF